MFESVLRERGIPLPDQPSAVMVLAKDVARQVLQGKVEARVGAERLAKLANELSSPPPSIWIFSGLELEISDFSDWMRIDY